MTLSVKETARPRKRAAGAAKIAGGEIVCAAHGKRLGVITERGIELWCKADGGHPVLLPKEEILRAFLKQ